MNYDELKRADKFEDPNTCPFCESIYTDHNVNRIRETILWHNYNFIIRVNEFPYRDNHIMLIPRVHTRSVYDLGEETISEYNEIVRALVNYYKIKFGSVMHWARENTPNQSVYHYHHHFIPTDEWIKPVDRVEYKLPEIELRETLHHLLPRDTHE